jgi:hypothetical protein
VNFHLHFICSDIPGTPGYGRTKYISVHTIFQSLSVLPWLKW